MNRSVNSFSLQESHHTPGLGAGPTGSAGLRAGQFAQADNQVRKLLRSQGWEINESLTVPVASHLHNVHSRISTLAGTEAGAPDTVRCNYFALYKLAWVMTAVILMLSGCTREKESGALQGYVEGEFVYMAAPQAGLLQTLNVSQGQTVTSGTILFALDPSAQEAARAEAEHKLSQGREQLEDAMTGKRPTEIEQLEAQLKQAEAALDLAMKTFERQNSLFKNKIISAEELDHARSEARQKQETVSQMKAQLATGLQGDREHLIHSAQDNVKALEAALRQTEWNLQQTSQTAPQDALVFDTYFRPGEFVPAGRAIISLLPPQNIKVRAFVPQAVVGSLQMDTTATISVDGVADPFVGNVSFISPKAEFTPPVIYSRENRQKLSFMVEISFPPEVAVRLHPGQPVDVEFSGQSE